MSKMVSRQRTADSATYNRDRVYAIHAFTLPPFSHNENFQIVMPHNLS
jgi:hypothetical protein